MNSYQTLRTGGSLSERDLEYLRGGEPKGYQLASLAIQILHAKRPNAEALAVLEHTLRTHAVATDCLRAALPDDARLASGPTHRGSVDPELAAALRDTALGVELGERRIRSVVERFTADEVPLEFMSTWLMTICERGFSDSDTRALTLVMRDSGRCHDYRNMPALGGARIIRRYPTGALSEKAALILPALLASVRDRYPVMSPFLVARSLGFTGGTWDKLKSIPGFTFPDPGEGSVRAMQRCGVAMAVTHGDVNPADRKMYAFRSTCGTIESHPLLVSSIASKQLALPADHLLMDVRWGDGAFCATREAGDRLGRDLARLISEGGAPASYELTDTAQPNGTAVGNAFEVLEAIAVMSREHEASWDRRALDEQRDLVLRFFRVLMERTFVDDKTDFAALGAAQFDSGRVFDSFLDVLAAHDVSEEVRASLRRSPMDTIGPRAAPSLVRARRSGQLQHLDQRGLGFAVNFKLGGGGNEYAGEFEPRAGVILAKRLGDTVEPGDVLCSVHAGERSRADFAAILDDIAACFRVE